MKVKFSALLSLTALILTISNFAIAQTPNEVQIGTQIWMTKNLDVSKFRNGDPIPEAKTDEEWVKAGENKQPAWCYYENNPANGAKYGKLYNWYAVSDARGLAPVGYHIPGTLDSLSILAYVPSSKDSAETLLSLVELRQDFKTAEYDLEFAQAISENVNYKVLAPDGFSEYPIEIQAEIKQGAMGDVIGPFFQGSSYYLLKISDTSVERAMCRARHILIKDGPESRLRIESFKKIIQQKNNFEEIAMQYSEDPGSGSQGGDLGWFSRGQMVKSFEENCFNAEIGELNVVQSDFGWHLVEVLGFSTGWKICQIEKMILPSEETILKATHLIEQQRAQGEWELLVEFIEGGENKSAGALKSSHGWERGDWCLSNEMLRASFQIENYSPSDFYLSEEFSLDNYNPNGYDEYGYNALPGGWRHNQGIYSSPGTSARFWCRNSTDRENASSRGLDDGPEKLDGIALPKGCGLSVRCIKD